MKMKKTFLLVLACIGLLTGFSACNDDGPVDLDLGVRTFYAKLGEEASLYIYSGNGGYIVSTDNDAVISAKVEGQVITITPKSKGKAILTLKDSDERIATASVTVTDPYMAFAVLKNDITVSASNSQTASTIKTELEKSPVLVKDQLYDFAKTEAKRYSVYKESWFKDPVSSGEFEFSTENKSLSLTTGGKEHVFTFEDNNTFAKEFYDYFTTTTSKPSTSTADPIFTVTENLTQEYKEKYPDAGIQEVTISSAVLLYRYRAEYNLNY